MAESLPRRGALAGAPPIAGSGLRIRERPPLAMINLRGNPADRRFVDAVHGALGLALPPPGGSAAAGAVAALGLGPDEWLIVADAGAERPLAAALRAALGATPAAATEVGDGRAVIRLSGARARDVLVRGTTIDVHPRLFAAGTVAQTGLARADVIIHRVADEAAGEPAFDIYLARSFADYLWRWLAGVCAGFAP